MPTFLLCVLVGAFPGGKDDSLVQAIRNAYEANLEALSSGTLRFRCTSGNAESLDAVLAGRWTDRNVGEGLFASNGTDSRYECLFPPADLNRHRRRLDEGSFYTTLTSVRVLTDGRLTLIDRVGATRDGTMHTYSPRLFGGTTEYYQNVTLPLALGGKGQGYLHLGADIARASAPDSQWRLTAVDDDEELDGAAVIKLTFESPETGRIYWVDPARGAIPLKVESYRKGKLLLTFLRKDLRFLSNKGWYPFREVSFVQGGIAREYLIDETSDFERPPAPATFRLAFPKPIPIINQAESVRYPGRVVWDLKTLPAADAPGTMKLKVLDPPVAAPGMPPGERDAPRRRTIILTVSAAILLSIGACFAVMKLRKP